VDWGSGVVLYNLLIFAYLLAVDGFFVVQGLAACLTLFRFHLRNRNAPPYRLFQTHLTPPICVLMPAYNEEASIVESVRGMCLLRYPSLEVVVINDGSRDRTLQVLIDTFGLRPIERAPLRPLATRKIRGVYASPEWPQLVVVDKENGGKADALNAGVSTARSPLFCAVDADSLLEADALERVVQPFIADPDTTLASGGFVRPINGGKVKAGRVVQTGLPRNVVALFQTVEYLRAFYLGRMGWSSMGGLLIISGAFGLFRTDAVARAGGYLVGSVGEDMELVVRLHRMMREQKRPYRVAFVPDSICWTQAPESFGLLGRQRDRWHRGLLDTLLRHRRMLFDPVYGAPGTIAMPYFWLVEVLGPFIEVSGYVMMPLAAWLGMLNWADFWGFMALSVLFGVLLSIWAVLAEELGLERHRPLREVVVLLGVAVLENFGYRQLNSWWRLRAVAGFLRRRESWGEMERKGFSRAA
jgi:cellulose synthase/poly-beta-1,6-N-acetylglucosamine synthase-like glycosyltransferase